MVAVPSGLQRREERTDRERRGVRRQQTHRKPPPLRQHVTSSSWVGVEEREPRSDPEERDTHKCRVPIGGARNVHTMQTAERHAFHVRPAPPSVSQGVGRGGGVWCRPQMKSNAQQILSTTFSPSPPNDSPSTRWQKILTRGPSCHSPSALPSCPSAWVCVLVRNVRMTAAWPTGLAPQR